ncbi:MAG TPA: urease accessory UreF family protein, partial [Acidimicrobiales bacterium]|nr:urease accessory UreF family protein [Acidimicrobiales bacterium]
MPHLGADPAPAATLLLLADGRLPTGGHAHSGGLEAAVRAGLVTGIADLERWLTGRLATVGAVDAALAAASWARAWGRPLVAVGGEWAARTPVAAVRAAGLAQGRGLLRVARRAWPDAVHDLPTELAWPVALGAVCRRVGLPATAATSAAAGAATSGPAWAATRLLGCDPYEVAAVLARLAPAL